MRLRGRSLLLFRTSPLEGATAPPTPLPSGPRARTCCSPQKQMWRSVLIGSFCRRARTAYSALRTVQRPAARLPTPTGGRRMAKSETQWSEAGAVSAGGGSAPTPHPPALGGAVRASGLAGYQSPQLRHPEGESADKGGPGGFSSLAHLHSSSRCALGIGASGLFPASCPAQREGQPSVWLDRFFFRWAAP